MNNPAKQLQELGVSPWLDNITRAMLRDGTLADYTERFGLRGLTSNPPSSRRRSSRATATAPPSVRRAAARQHPARRYA